MYAELIEGSITNRGKVVHVHDLGYFNKARDYEAYASAFTFDIKIQEYVNQMGSVRDFSGKAYSEFMWFDIDSKSLNVAQKSTIDLISNLNKKYDVTANQLLIFFSGMKGFHVGLHQNLFKGLINKGGYDHPDRIKMLALEIAGNVVIDRQVYNKTRIFRIPNSLHAKSKLYKIPISYQELCGSIEDIKDMAENPRPKWTYNIKNISANTRLIEQWRRIIIQKEVYVREESTESFFAVPKEGGRDNALFRQSCMLLDHGMPQIAVNDIMEVYRKQCNIDSADLITPNDLARILKSAISKTASNVREMTAKKMIDERDSSRIELKTFEEYITPYHEMLNDTSGRIYLGNSKIDQHLKGRLRGKICACVGYGGTKKSLFSLQLLLNNINGEGLRGIYSTMEQSVYELMNRIVSYSTTYGHEQGNTFKINAADWIEQNMKSEAADILRKYIAPSYGRNLWLTPTTSLTYGEYDIMLSNLQEREGKIDMLVIDGLSRMGGDKNEVERYSNNMREIKDLSQKYGIFIVIMCHASKGKKLYTRDVREVIRGSEKIIDEVDFTITNSLIIDADRTIGETIEYRPDKLWIRFYDKRGTGATEDCIYDFDPQRLALIPSNEDPRIYDIKPPKGDNDERFD